jgi:hypothetical protein
MPIFENAGHFVIDGGTFTDVQGDIINHYSIQESEQGVL